MDAIQERLQEEIVHKSTRLTFQRMVPQHTLYNMKHMIGCRNIYQIRQALEGLNVEEISGEFWCPPGRPWIKIFQN